MHYHEVLWSPKEDALSQISHYPEPKLWLFEILNTGFPYPVRALRVRLLVAPGGPGMAHGFLPLTLEGTSRIAPRSSQKTPNR